jgi:hypothetical protein
MRCGRLAHKRVCGFLRGNASIMSVSTPWKNYFRFCAPKASTKTELLPLHTFCGQLRPSSFLQRLEGLYDEFLATYSYFERFSDVRDSTGEEFCHRSSAGAGIVCPAIGSSRIMVAGAGTAWTAWYAYICPQSRPTQSFELICTTTTRSATVASDHSELGCHLPSL